MKPVYSIVSLCIASLAFNACGGSQQPAPTAPPPPSVMAPPPASTPAPVVSAAPAPEPAVVPSPTKKKSAHMMHHPALAMLMADSSQVGLSAEQQKVVDAIEADLEKQADALKEPHAQLITDFADGVTAGKLDRKKIDADSKKLMQAGDATVKSVQDAANKLHQTLDAAQRKKLSELLLAKAEEMHGHGMGPMHGHGPGGETDKGSKSEQGAPPAPTKAEPGAGPKGPDEHAEHHGADKHEMGHHPGMNPQAALEKLSELLGLTQEQRDKLKTKMEAMSKSQAGSMKAEHEAMQKHVKAIAEAFATDKFDAKKAGLGEKHGDMMKSMVKSRLEFIEAILSVLTPEQRTKFAEHIRQQAGESEAAE